VKKIKSEAGAEGKYGDLTFAWDITSEVTPLHKDRFISLKRDVSSGRVYNGVL